MRIAPNTHTLDISSGGAGMFPVLTWDDEHTVLIDAGYPGQLDLFVRAIADAGRRAEDITQIILTHQDIDHIGCVRGLLELAPGARVVAHVDEAAYIDGTLPPIKGFPSLNIHVDQTVADGEVLPYCGGIEVVHAPGHTPGSMCLFLRSSGIMVGGDAFNIAHGSITGPNPQYTQDMDQGRRSLERILARKPAAVVAYHGGYLKCE
ncbi:MAG: MBL fold metallo-hydrolase [Oscillospiraceae bacterium]|jgi:glyoxylase-like metal-dependent hydrolase (beta-lactamase superfamily II)|nr:MBL fold metallo-hydrolase [Oscillospiraceae bacterium]